jgi:hypothetical protein
VLDTHNQLFLDNKMTTLGTKNEEILGEQRKQVFLGPANALSTFSGF